MYEVYSIYRFKAQHRNVYNAKYTFGFPAATDPYEKSAEADTVNDIHGMLRRLGFTEFGGSYRT